MENSKSLDQNNHDKFEGFGFNPVPILKIELISHVMGADLNGIL